MKTNLLGTFILLTIVLAACQAATPLPPMTTTKDVEFTLGPDQTATLADIGMTIRLIGVTGDSRCPSELECAMSGPVSISLSAQIGNKHVTNFNLRSFTDNNGRAPGMKFEGIEDRIVYQGFLIRVAAVLPYPVNFSKKIKDSEYRVTLIVTQE